jgi:L-alanine-DL-glutamate epimerase-like enolase superfamily enzyme
VLTELEFDGLVGYGEASMPPYLGESQQSVMSFLSKVDFNGFSDPCSIVEILQYIDSIAPGNNAAKASVDIALHDLVGKIKGQPWYGLWGYNPYKATVTSFTIGIDSPEMVIQKTIEASPYKILKVKVANGNEKAMIDAVRSVTDKPLYIDVNQGWTDRNYALNMVYWLKDRNVLFIEQPLSKGNLDDIAWLSAHSPLPIFADEAIRRLSDLKSIYGAYNGVNIKLMKSTGMHEAHQMLEFAKSVGMKTMIGCMTETSCAISAAAHLSPNADYADLDGALLIKNDVFNGMEVVDGRIVLNNNPGIGVEKIC